MFGVLLDLGHKLADNQVDGDHVGVADLGDRLQVKMHRLVKNRSPLLVNWVVAANVLVVFRNYN